VSKKSIEELQEIVTGYKTGYWATNVIGYFLFTILFSLLFSSFSTGLFAALILSTFIMYHAADGQVAGVVMIIHIILVVTACVKLLPAEKVIVSIFLIVGIELVTFTLLLLPHPNTTRAVDFIAHNIINKD